MTRPKGEPRSPYTRWSRWPFAPLESLIHAESDEELAEQLDVSSRTVLRWRESGLTAHQADRAACRRGLVPALVWSDDDVFDLRDHQRTNRLTSV